MTEKPRNDRRHFSDYVTIATCDAIREGNMKHLQSQIELLNEKLKSVKAQITIGFTVSTIVIAVVQFLLGLR